MVTGVLVLETERQTSIGRVDPSAEAVLPTTLEFSGGGTNEKGKSLGAKSVPPPFWEGLDKQRVEDVLLPSFSISII